MFVPVLFIEFYDKMHGAVKLDWSSYPFIASSPTTELLYDTGLFASYLLRELRNSGQHPMTEALIHEVKRHASMASITELPGKIEDVHVIFFAGAAIGLSEAQMMDYEDPLYLVEYKGKGMKRFIGSVDARLDQFLFTLSVKGFGLGYLIGLGLSTYTPEAVLLFLAYLRMKHQNHDYDLALQSIIDETIAAYEYGRTTFQNQEFLAFEITRKWLK